MHLKFLLFYLFMTFSSQAQTNAHVPSYVESMPEFPGGMDKLVEFLSGETEFPPSLQKDSTFKGDRGIIQFIVDEDGYIREPKDAKFANALCAKEALRVVSIMPKWIPGYQNGEAVKVRFVLPFNFSLVDEE